MVSGGAPPKTGFWHPVPAKMGLPAARVAVVSVSWLNHATAGLVSLERSLGVDVQKDKWPSTGFFGMLLAMQLCRTVDIYGFGRRLRNGSQLDPSMIKYYM
ncbi:unnamed protein product [Prorocentrum cordatum]|uniref:Uncharacterized protein n=1 Tax=Prorocentrum cordatum TaxID=2364126 RepID=A0ABN9SZ41_9DINO|nr:unnamed protein product [Polarella glacialis]